MMTTAPNAPETEVLEWKPRGHPVRVALAIVGVIVVLSWVLMCFGAGQPRVRTEVVATERPPGSDEFEVTVEITNRAQGSVTLLDVGESVGGLDLLSSDIKTEPGGPSVERAELGAGDEAWVVLRYRATNCDALWEASQNLPVRTRTMLGLRRTVTAGLSYDVELPYEATFGPTSCDFSVAD
jgi:hypothetical protein